MTYKDELFQETVTHVERPSKHFTLLRAPDGNFLGTSDSELATFDHVDDKAIWERVEGAKAYRHVVTGLLLNAESASSANGCYLRHRHKSNERASIRHIFPITRFMTCF